MEGISEKARELGRLLGQTNEYQALSRARTRAVEDAQLSQALRRLGELERQIATALRSGQEPGEAEQEEYESLFGQLQGSATYQGLVAAQSNFDKILARVNDHITEGIETGAKSRIILPT